MDVAGVCVIAKSPLLRIHGNTLFLTEIQDGLSGSSNQFLLARGDEASSFFSNIVVGSCYDFINLTPTTITKGTDRPRKILLLTAYSKINPCRKDDISIDINIPAHEGKITKCIDQTLGIYELTRSRRLYLTYQYDGKSLLPIIPVGSEVIIHNAHKIDLMDKESKSGIMIRCESIVCCMRSSFDIIGNLEEHHPAKEKSSHVQKILLPLCGKLTPNLTVLEWLRLQGIPALLQKLVPSVLQPKEMLPVLVQLLTSKMTSNDLPIIEKRKRNPYEDFLSHDQACYFSRPQRNISKHVAYTFPSVTELPDCLNSPSNDGHSHVTSLVQSGWICSVLRSCDISVPMILVAKLCCQGTDGRLYLVDSTGSIPCTLAKILPSKEGAKSFKSEVTEGSNSRSSINDCYPQPCLNHLLRIDDFVVILERRTCSEENTENNDMEHDNKDGGKDGFNSKDKVYVMFDPRNAVCLHRGQERAISPGSDRPRRRKRSSSNSEGTPPDSVISKTFLLRSRRQLLRDHRNQEFETPSFYCDIIILDSYHVKKTKKDAFQRQGDGDDGKSVERMDDGKEALLCFHGDAVMWYNFLREGHCYKMDCKNDDMQTHVVPSVMKLSKKGMTQPVYIITSYSQLKILQDSVHPALQTLHQNSSTDTMLQSKGKQRQNHLLASISGLITRKTLQDTSREEAHTSRQEMTDQSSSIHLEVQDIATQSSVRVSIPPNTHHYILGLVPGATVCIRNCLKKIDPGIAVTYDIGPLTSILVESFSTTGFQEIASIPETCRNIQQSFDTRSLHTMKQRSFLYHMIQDTSRNPSCTHWIYAHIALITKLVLRWICNHCGRNDCKCTSTGRQDGKIISQIVVAVDDGSGECLIWSNKPNVVSNVLGLTPREWTVMEDSCTGPNKELVYRKLTKGRQEEYDWEASAGYNQRQSRLSLAVSKLCQHISVQRSLWFKTRRFRESTKELSTEKDKSTWPAGLVLCCDDISY